MVVWPKIGIQCGLWDHRVRVDPKWIGGARCRGAPLAQLQRAPLARRGTPSRAAAKRPDHVARSAGRGLGAAQRGCRGRAPLTGGGTLASASAGSGERAGGGLAEACRLHSRVGNVAAPFRAAATSAFGGCSHPAERAPPRGEARAPRRAAPRAPVVRCGGTSEADARASPSNVPPSGSMSPRCPKEAPRGPPWRDTLTVETQ
jgi:hypothetical protein